MSGGDHYKLLLREFTDVGIKPEVDRTNGGHLRFTYEVNGQRETIVTAFTPSDWRGTLNTRGLIRRELRAAGVYERTDIKPPPLAKALQLPKGTDPLAVRVTQLEQDLSVMLELVQEATEMASKAGYEAGWAAHGVAVAKALAHLPVPNLREAAKPHLNGHAANGHALNGRGKTKTPREKKETKRDLVLRNLRYDEWRSAIDIAKHAKMTYSHVSNVMTGLRKAKMVENLDGKWRLRVPPEAAHHA